MSYYDDMVDRFFFNLVDNRLEAERFELYARTGRNSLWTCKDGSKVRIGDMTNDHLENTIKMLEKHDPTHTALAYLRYEKRYRTEYPSLLKAIKTQEDIINNIL